MDWKNILNLLVEQEVYEGGWKTIIDKGELILIDGLVP